jgi:hypothetical protein
MGSVIWKLAHSPLPHGLYGCIENEFYELGVTRKCLKWFQGIGRFGMSTPLVFLLASDKGLERLLIARPVLPFLTNRATNTWLQSTFARKRPHHSIRYRPVVNTRLEVFK